MSRKTLSRIARICLCVVLLCALALSVFKYAEEIVTLKQKIYTAVEKNRLRAETPESPAGERRDPSAITQRQFAGDEWFFNTRTIYHACGGIDGLPYTNSREALEHTLDAFGKDAVIEVDFCVTADSRLVCLHDWVDMEVDAPMTCEAFLARKIYGKYTPLSAEDLLAYMEAYPDLRIVVDTKGSVVDVVRELAELTRDPEILDRFIVQLYAGGEKEQILKMYAFPEENFLYTAYMTGDRPEYILTVCEEENISVVTLPGDWYSEEWEVFLEKGFILYTHTVNRPDVAREFIRKGIHGVYTDFLSPADLQETGQ